MASILRPGRFLGSHYLAFTIPNRTFIITLDKVKNGIRVARFNKKAAQEAKLLFEAGLDNTSTVPPLRLADVVPAHITPNQLNPQKGFFARFVDGYTGVTVDEMNQERHERLTNVISEWFGRQQTSTGDNQTTSQTDTDDKEDTKELQ
jgi:hypothetical protein